jgi:hypothetical protein
MSRTEELNQRIRQRNVGDTPQFYFSPRPVPTKYTAMPIVDEQKSFNVPIKKESTFDTTLNFLPATSAPWTGFVDQVDTETNLMRTSNFTPLAKSDMYYVHVPNKEEQQPYPLLFASIKTSDSGIKPHVKETRTFNNVTSLKTFNKGV